MKEWFPHDYAASTDAKVRSLIRRTGAAGYGMYWHFVEMMHVERSIPYAVAVDAIGMGLNCSDDEVTRFLDMAITIGLVEVNSDKILTIPRVTRNLSDREQIKERKTKAAEKRWQGKQTTPGPNADAMHVQCTCNADAMQMQCTCNANTIQDKTIQDSKEVMKKTSLPALSPTGLRADVPALRTNTGDAFPILQDDVHRWSELYPAVDVLQELRKMVGWLDANPSRRKTARGMRAFIANWLSKQQDRGNGQQQAAKRTTGDRAMAGSDPVEYIASVAGDRQQYQQLALPGNVARGTLVAAEIRAKD